MTDVIIQHLITDQKGRFSFFCSNLDENYVMLKMFQNISTKAQLNDGIVSVWFSV